MNLAHKVVSQMQLTVLIFLSIGSRIIDLCGVIPFTAITAAVATVETSVIFTLETHDCDGSDKTYITPFTASQVLYNISYKQSSRRLTDRNVCDWN